LEVEDFLLAQMLGQLKDLTRKWRAFLRNVIHDHGPHHENKIQLQDKPVYVFIRSRFFNLAMKLVSHCRISSIMISAD